MCVSVCFFLFACACFSASYFGIDFFCFDSRHLLTVDSPQEITRTTVRLDDIDHGFWIGWRSPFRNSLTDENAIRIFVVLLFVWIVNAYCIDACGPCLHLQLGIVYSWFIIHKHSCQWMCDRLPWLHTGIADETREHCTHTKIDPSCRMQTPHPCIYQRNSCLSMIPTIDQVVIDLLSDLIKPRILVTKLDSRSRFQFLDKMTTPMHTRRTCTQAPTPLGQSFCFFRRQIVPDKCFELCHPSDKSLIELSLGDIAIGEIGRES